jgi:AcrR family transcriptional regulator
LHLLNPAGTNSRVARPKNQTERRRQLAEAAGRAIVARGAAAVRLKDIAEQAGVTPGAVLYYYPDVNALLVEAHRSAGERFCEDRIAALAEIDDPRDRMLAAIRTGLPTGPEDESVRMLYEMDALVGKSALYSALTVSFFERQVALYQVILEAGVARGLFELTDDSHTLGRNLVALEDAHGLHVLMGDSPIDRDEAERLIIAYASAVTRCDLRSAELSQASLQA